jgi:hypothetical protein
MGIMKNVKALEDELRALENRAFDIRQLLADPDLDSLRSWAEKIQKESKAREAKGWQFRRGY